MNKQLTRTVGKERKVLGVCGGIAKYFAIDPTIIRIIAAIIIFMNISIFVIYLLLAFAMPEDTSNGYIQADYSIKSKTPNKTEDDMRSDGTGKDGWN